MPSGGQTTAAQLRMAAITMNWNYNFSLNGYTFNYGRPMNTAGHYIFALWFLLLLLPFFFFPRLISAVADWMSTILPHIVWSYCKFRMQHAGLKRAARGLLEIQDAKMTPKIAICAPSHNFVALYLRN